jgi:hypothetical protein
MKKDLYALTFFIILLIITSILVGIVFTLKEKEPCPPQPTGIQMIDDKYVLIGPLFRADGDTFYVYLKEPRFINEKEKETLKR